MPISCFLFCPLRLSVLLFCPDDHLWDWTEAAVPDLGADGPLIAQMSLRRRDAVEMMDGVSPAPRPWLSSAVWKTTENLSINGDCREVQNETSLRCKMLVLPLGELELLQVFTVHIRKIEYGWAIWP